MGDQVAFRGTPDLFTAAHEAAHVVQQRGGVQLRGGVGQAGDRYEQHADAVAHAVVRGESAEALLDAHAGGQAKTAVQLKGEGDPWRDKIRQKLDDAKDTHVTAFDKQALACRVLVATAGTKDPPSLKWQLLTLAAELAMTAGTAAIASKIAVGISNRLSSQLAINQMSKDSIKIVADTVKDTSKGVIKKIQSASGQLASSAASQYPVGTRNRAAKICFHAQEAGLLDAKLTCKKSYNAHKRKLLGKGKAGYAAACALVKSAEAAKDQAVAIQRSHSVQQWAVYQAKCVRGQTKAGETNMSKSRLLQKDLGVLHLKGEWFNGGQPRLTSARMAGMNSATRQDIQKVPLGQLQVPVQLRLDIGVPMGWVDRYVSKKTQMHVDLGRDEKGSVWVGPDSPAFGALAQITRTGHQLNYGAHGTSVQAKDRYAAARAVFKALAPFKPPLK
jgi:hypothetical protein